VNLARIRHWQPLAAEGAGHRTLALLAGLPGNALVVVPLSKPKDEVTDKLKQGPVVIKPDQMWELLGFNGPAVQVQDNEGRPIMIGLEDLLAGLEKHWQENKDDLNRGRLREIDKVTKLLNALAGSQNPQVKQFAVESARAVAQMLQQQQLSNLSKRPS
jgi:hypothetical protein